MCCAGDEVLRLESKELQDNLPNRDNCSEENIAAQEEAFNSCNELADRLLRDDGLIALLRCFGHFQNISNPCGW